MIEEVKYLPFRCISYRCRTQLASLDNVGQMSYTSNGETFTTLILQMHLGKLYNYLKLCYTIRLRMTIR